MKKVVYLVMAAIIAISCNPTGDNGEGGGTKQTVFSISPTSSKVTALAQNLEFNVKCDNSWDAFMNLETWAKIQVKDPASGKVVVALRMNDTENERTDTLVVFSGKQRLKVPITQQGIESLLSRTEVTLTGLESQTIEIASGGSWSAAPVNSGYGDDWLEISPAGGTAGTTSVTFTAKEENYNIGDRNVLVKFLMDEHIIFATVTQKQTNAILKDRDKVELSNGEQEFSLDIQSNVDVSMKIEGDWIEEVQTKAMNRMTPTFKVSANPEQTVREGKIIFTGGGITETVSVFQAECDVLAFTSGTVEVPAEGGISSIELRSNVEYEIVWPDVDWLTEVESSMSTCAIRSDMLQFEVKTNFKPIPREAEITVFDKNSELSSTIRIVQICGIPAFASSDVYGVYGPDGEAIYQYVKKQDQTSTVYSGETFSFRILSPEESLFIELSGIPTTTENWQMVNATLMHNRDFEPKGEATKLEVYVTKQEKGKLWLVTEEGLGFIIKK